MANMITNNSVDENVYLRLSNGGMSVVITILSLAGSHLAKKTCEVDLVTWLASRDQSVFGVGVVGFDLAELPWSKKEETFIRQKDFLLKVVERVGSKEDLYQLDYDPPYIDEYVETLFVLVNSFSFHNVSDEKPSWWLPPDKQHKKCEKHGVYMHANGCVVCNDQ